MAIDYSNIIEIDLESVSYVEISDTNARTRYDTGQYVQFAGIDLPDTYEVRFCNSKTDTATVVEADSDTVAIPDALFETGKPVYVWIVLSNGEDDSRSFLVAKIDVNPGPKVESED